MKKSGILTSVVVAVLLVLGLAIPVAAQVELPPVNAELAPGESIIITKEVTTPPIPPDVDIVLLEDETGSFMDDIENLQGGTTASDIYDTIVANTASSQFGVTGFRDYPISPHGSPGDWVYRELSVLSPAKVDWLAGVAALTAGGGANAPEAQYDAIVAAATSPTIGWRADPVQRVLVVATDAPFHLPGAGKPHVNTEASTIAALNANNIIIIGLKAPGAGSELDALAAATGGSVQALSPDGANIAQAILDGLEELTTDVWWEVEADDGLIVELMPGVYFGVTGDTTVIFEEKITATDDAPQCNKICATVTFFANHWPDEGAVIATQEVCIKVKDVTDPVIECIESVNPHGNNIPGEKRSDKAEGVNPDGFYQLVAEDNCDPEPDIYVTYIGSGDPMLFGPFTSGTVVKITQAPGATPSAKKIGSSNGQAGAVICHITVPDDPIAWALDDSGNHSGCRCLVPPPPK
jgi:hypothetical protein